MLDLAALLKDNSRLGMTGMAGALDASLIFSLHRFYFIFHRHPLFQGCQIILSKELEGMELKLPEFTRNFYVDGHVPQPH